jgi:hypothetical protein
MSTVEQALLLWQGGGDVGQRSRARRVRLRLRTVATEHPWLYLPFARRKYPGPSPRVVDHDTEAVIDGYTRSASTFAVYAFQVAQPEPVRLAHHLHAPAQLMEAARRGLPTIMVIREPRGAVLSQVVREPGVDVLDALWAYSRFHESLAGCRDAFVVADFDQVTGDFGAVVRRMNARYGTSYGVFDGSVDQLAWCRRLVGQRDTLSPVLLGFESGDVTLDEVKAHVLALPPAEDSGDRTWMPSAERSRAKEALAASWSEPRLAAATSRAEAVYRWFVRDDAHDAS